MRKIGHIINPYQVSEDSEDHLIQQLSMQSLIQAKSNFARPVDIEIIAVTHESENIKLSNDFIRSAPMTRYIGDINDQCLDKKLPLLVDIIQLGSTSTDADYYVYSNIDIILHPNFYTEIENMIQAGHDAFVINRRRVGKEYLSLPLNNQIFSEMGMMHNGYDCFVFKNSIIPKLNLGLVCIGIPHVGNTLFYNLIEHSKNFKLFTDCYLTFHIGYELVKNWGSSAYLNHNRKEFKAIAKQSIRSIKIDNFPGSNRSFIKRHFKWLMNPTIHYPSIAMHDIKNLRVKRRKRLLKPINSINYSYHEWLQEKIRLE